MWKYHKCGGYIPLGSWFTCGASLDEWQVSEFSHYRDSRSTVLLDSQGFEVECEAWNLLTLQMIFFCLFFCLVGMFFGSFLEFWRLCGVCGHWKFWYSIVRWQVNPLCKYCIWTILEVRESYDDKTQRKFNPIIVWGWKTNENWFVNSNKLVKFGSLGFSRCYVKYANVKVICELEMYMDHDSRTRKWIIPAWKS